MAVHGVGASLRLALWQRISLQGSPGRLEESPLLPYAGRLRQALNGCNKDPFLVFLGVLVVNLRRCGGLDGFSNRQENPPRPHL